VKHLRKPVRVAAQMAKFSILRHIEADNQQSGAFPRLATTGVDENGNVFGAAPAEEPPDFSSPCNGEDPPHLHGAEGVLPGAHGGLACTAEPSICNSFSAICE